MQTVLKQKLFRAGLLLETAKKSYWPVTGLWNSGPLKDLNDFKLIVYESKWFPLTIQYQFHSICCFLWQTGSSHFITLTFWLQTKNFACLGHFLKSKMGVGKLKWALIRSRNVLYWFLKSLDRLIFPVWKCSLHPTSKWGATLFGE